MANQLFHYPFDRGIDQSKDTAGSEEPIGLKACSNLWHSRTGVLSTRPGTERAGGNVPAAALPVAAVSGDLILAGGTAYTRTADPDWTSVGYYARPVPLGSRDVGGRIDVTDDDQIVRHVTVWESALLVASTDGNGITVSIYHRETEALLREVTLSGGDVPGCIIGWADHGDVSPSLYVRGSTESTTYRRVTFDEADNYASTTQSLSSGIDARAIVCGHAGGAAHVAFVSGSVRYFSSKADTAPDSFDPSMSMPSITTCFSHEGLAWFAGVAFSTLYVLTMTGSTNNGIDTVAPSDTSKIKPVIVATGTNTAAVFVNAPTVNGSVSRFPVTASPGPSIGSENATYLRQAFVLGGALFDGSAPYVWAMIGNAGTSLDSKVVLIRATVSSDATARRTGLAHDGFMSTTTFGAVWPASGHAPASGQFPETWATGLYDLTDVTDNTLAQSRMLHFAMHAPRRTAEFLGRQLVPGGALTDMFGECGHTMPQTYPVITDDDSASGSLSAGDYQFTAVHYKRDHDGTIRRGPPSSIRTVAVSAGTGVELTLGFDETLPPGWELAIYRTEADGTIFYLDGFSPPGTTYVSSQNDTNLSNNEILYTEGGVLTNDAAPSHRFLAVGKGRAWLGGLAQAFRVRFSKEGVRGETPAFPDDASHWLDLGSNVTAIACMDDVTLAFHRDSVDLIIGDGPDARGVGAFQVRPATVGVGADDWRSVVVTPVGVFFAGNGTIWLMGRGFAPPENVGSLVRDVLADYPEVLSSALVDYGHQQCVQFLCSGESGVTRLVFSLRSLQWYQWDGLSASLLGLANISGDQRLCLLPEAFPSPVAPLLVETEASTADTTTPIATAVQLHQLHMWGLAADARVRRVFVRYRATEASTWSVTLEANGGARDEVKNFSAVERPGYQIASFGMREQNVQSVGISLTAGPVTLAGAVVEYEAEGAPKLGANQRRG